MVDNQGKFAFSRPLQFGCVGRVAHGHMLDMNGRAESDIDVWAVAEVIRTIMVMVDNDNNDDKWCDGSI